MSSDTLSRRRAEPILGFFGLQASEVQEIRRRSSKVVWRVETDKGAVALVRSASRPDTLFTAAVQEHLHQAADLAPRVFRTSSGALLLSHGGNYYSVSRWVPGKHPNLKRRDGEGLCRLMRGMAHMHVAARHFQPPRGAAERDRTLHWPEVYRAILDQMNSDVKESWPREVSSMIKEFAPPLLAMGEELLKALIRSESYRKVAAGARADRTLIHGDTTRINVRFVDERAVWIDFERAAYDIQVRDIALRLERMVRRSWRRWNESGTLQALNAYEQVRPMFAEERRLLWIDLSFPHQFARLLRMGRRVSSGEVERVGRASVEIAERLRKECL